MFGEKHELINELPEFRERILQLREADERFSKLYDEYHALDDEVLRMEEGFETPSDEVLEELKKKRLYLKDQLFDMLQHAE
jgi:uncharacterized protein YdcH (DUF465 family)